MGRRTYALHKNKIYSWIDLLDKFNIEHQEGASAHVEWNNEVLRNKKLPAIKVVDKDGNDDNDKQSNNGNSNNSSQIPKAVRDAVWMRDIGNSKSGKCYICPRTITDDNFEAGHIISKHNNGNDDYDNLRAVCIPCNRSMGTSNLEDYKEKHYSNNTSKLNLNVITKEDVIQFLETHKLNDVNVKFFDKAIELLKKY